MVASAGPTSNPAATDACSEGPFMKRYFDDEAFDGQFSGIATTFAATH